MSIRKNVTIYTDGACSGNPGAGGWGAVLIHGDSIKEIAGYKSMTTNNEMELCAAVKALQLLKTPCSVELYSDSAYLINSFLQGWIDNWKKNGYYTKAKTPVANREYWEELDRLSSIHNIKWNKVKGHSDNKYNNICDKLATDQIAKNKPI